MGRREATPQCSSISIRVCVGARRFLRSRSAFWGFQFNQDNLHIGVGEVFRKVLDGWCEECLARLHIPLFGFASRVSKLNVTVCLKYCYGVWVAVHYGFFMRSVLYSQYSHARVFKLDFIVLRIDLCRVLSESS